jgi:hypothetical protein
MLIGLIGEFEQRQGEIGRDRHVEFGFAECGHDDGMITDAARDLLAAHVQFRVQAAHWKCAVVGILNVELDCETLLQEIPAAHLDADDGHVRPRIFGCDQRAAAEETESGGQ